MRALLIPLISGLLLSAFALSIAWFMAPSNALGEILWGAFFAGLAISVVTSLHSRLNTWMAVTTVCAVALFVLSFLPIYAGHGSGSIYAYHTHSFWDMVHDH